MTEMLQVVLADPHPTFRVGMQTILKTHPTIEIIEAIDSRENLLEYLKHNHPHLILIHSSLAQQENGLNPLAHIHLATPTSKTMIILDQGNVSGTIQALLNGAVGVITRDVTPCELPPLIERGAQGQRVFSFTVVEALLAQLLELPEMTADCNPVVIEALTEREGEVLELIAQGLSNEEIAEVLALQVGTVKAHVSNILSKLQVKNRAQAALLAVGQFSPDEPICFKD